MRNSSRVLISLTLAFLPLTAMSAKPALAEEILGAGDAAAHLARAHGAAVKCGHLTAPLREELSAYVNMAEVVAAPSVGPEEIVRMIEDGRQTGRSMACGNETEDLALSAMEAAREALSQADAEEATLRDTVFTAPEIEPAAPQQVQEQQQVALESSSSPREESAAKHAACNNRELVRYAQATAAYYIERRCQHLRHDRAVRFWKQVVSRHNAMLSSHDRAAVASAKARAKSIANASGSCGAKTRRIVSAGLSLVSRN